MRGGRGIRDDGWEMGDERWERRKETVRKRERDRERTDNLYSKYIPTNLASFCHTIINHNLH